jgi:1,5-anhydro-D-fructose reductase (1,5-anhydro-D-mannitol-forming)
VTVAQREQPVNWGFVGASQWASSYMIPAVQNVPGSHAAGIFSTSRERGDRFAAELGLDRAYPALEELLDDPSIDAVYVSTTNDLHAEQTVAAAAAGKHVLCEKPLAVTLADAGRMRDACADAGVVLGTNHHLRGSPTVLAMKELLDAGAIGDVVAARVFHARSLPEAMRTWRVERPETGAGVVLDVTVHDVDVIRFLLADEVDEVTAFTASQGLGKAGIEDAVMGVLRMRRGQLVSFHDAYTVPHAGTGIELHGTSGSLIGRDIVMPDPVGKLLLRRLDDVEEVDIPDRWPIYERTISRFNAAVRGDGTPLATGDDGVASLAVALAALESARSAAPISLAAVTS